MTTVWIRPPEGDDAKPVLTTALERGFDTFLLPAKPPEALGKLGRFTHVTVEGDRVLRDGEEVGRWVRLETGEDQEEAMELAGEVEIVVLDAADWKLIPAENLIAAYQGTGTRLLGLARSAGEARVLLETLEVGTDGVVLEAQTAEDVLALRDALRGTDGPELTLVQARITGVRPVGSGDRVCVDTANLLVPGEGMLVGSTSQALFLVHGETLESEYVASRPFRVNAGAVHAYLLLPDGRTRYLSEVSAGDEVLVADPRGRTRTALVGRVKVERRPLLLVEAEAEDRRFNTLLQNAETIRLVTPDGPRSVVDLEPGDEVLVRLETGGRHFGRRVEETIREA